MKLKNNSCISLVTALFVVAHIVFLKSGSELISDYLISLFISAIVSIPFFLTVILSYKQKGIRYLMSLASGFILYPFVVLAFFNDLVTSTRFTFSIDEFAVFWACYLLANLHEFFKYFVFARHNFNFIDSVNLSQVTIGLLVIVSLLLSLIISADPIITGVTENNISLNLELGNIALVHFVELLLQFLVLSSLIWVIYFVSSRLLIKIILAKYGVFSFICGVIVSVLTLTPILFSIALLLPIYDDKTLLFLSQVSNVFQKENYQIVLGAFVTFTPLILMFEKPKQEQEMQQLSEQRSMSEIKMLQQQVNPHFLFNTLNNIYAHSLSGSKKTPKLISNLSNMLRYTIYEGQRNKVNLNDEIQYLKNFIALQSLRARENLELIVHWPEEIDRDLNISPLLIIIIFENAFKHSIEKTSNDCKIELNLSVIGNTLRLDCKNTYVEQAKINTEPGGLGLDNLKKRLNLIYHKKHHIVSEKVDDMWHVELTIELDK